MNSVDLGKDYTASTLVSSATESQTVQHNTNHINQGLSSTTAKNCNV